ncbi:MAG: hypothetical protein ACI31S_02005 [Bacilli bacterium]
MIFQKLTSEDCNAIKKAEEKALTDYEMLGDFIPNDNLMTIIKDLLIELDKRDERIEELKEYKEMYCDLCN